MSKATVIALAWAASVLLLLGACTALRWLALGLAALARTLGL